MIVGWFILVIIQRLDKDKNMNKQQEKTFYDNLWENLRRDGENAKRSQETLDKSNRGNHVISEWHQDEDKVNELPQELKDLKIRVALAFSCALSGEEEIPDMAQEIGRSVEAAYNLGKQQPK